VPSVTAGAYTKDQADRGAKLYAESCAECHGENLQGREQALPLAGPEFTGAWEDEPLSGLLSRIRQMPPDQPVSWSRAQMVDMIAYILSYNGLPAGTTPLSQEQSVLTKVMFKAPPPKAQ
jgi:mono/diheme cytochrome c family protein